VINVWFKVEWNVNFQVQRDLLSSPESCSDGVFHPSASPELSEEPAEEAIDYVSRWDTVIRQETV
jgi:hypothetical protein